MTTGCDYKEELEKEFNFLDTIDLIPLIKNNMNIKDLMDNIEEKYLKDFQKIYPNEEYIFNWMNEYEFETYLEKRYKDKLLVKEEIITNYIIKLKNIYKDEIINKIKG